MCGVGGIPPEVAFCLASGNTARAHGLDTGVVRTGAPADLMLMGRIVAANGRDALGAMAAGDIPGISVILVDGEVLVAPRSQQLPPPETLATVVRH
jgi:enamidase